MAKIFKTTWFKCITVLVVLAVTLGGLLAILNDVLYVSTEERTARAIKKIYGEEVEYVVVTEQPITYQGLGTINKIYSVGDDTLFQATGENGYKGGTVTLWIKVVSNNTGSKVIDKVILDGFEKQTLMSKFDGSYYENFYQDITNAEDEDKYFSTSGTGDFSAPNTGATKSANAITSAVNCVIKYFSGVR